MSPRKQWHFPCQWPLRARVGEKSTLPGGSWTWRRGTLAQGEAGVLTVGSFMHLIQVTSLLRSVISFSLRVRVLATVGQLSPQSPLANRVCS